MANQVGNIIFEISADLKNVQGQLRTLEGSFQSSFSKIEGLAKGAAGAIAGVFGIGLSIGGAGLFLKSLVDLGDRLQDLSNQTGISIAVLGGIRPVLEENGSSLDAFARGVARFQRSLGDLSGQGKEAAEGLKAIGLDAKQLASATPDQAIELLARALGTVSNQNERTAVAFRILNRTAAELVPTFLDMAENGVPRLSDATAEAYNRLGQLRDQIVRLTASIYDFFAGVALGVDKLFNISPSAKLENSVRAAREEVDRLDKMLEKNRNAPGFMFGVLSSPQTQEARRTAEATGLQNQRNAALQKFIDLNSKLIAQQQVSQPGQFKDLLGKASPADNSALNALNSFIEGLQKQRDSLSVNVTELQKGSIASKELGLDLEFAAFKAKLLADGKMVPADAERRFLAVKQQILDMTGALAAAKLDSDLLKKSLEDVDKAFPEQQMPGEIISQLGLAQRQAAGEQLNPDDLKKMVEGEKQLQQIRDQVRIEGLTGEEQKNAQIWADFQKTQDQIQKLTDEGVVSQEEAAAATAEAWDLAWKKVGQSQDESSKLMLHAFKEIQDSIASGLNDLMSGNIKSWRDWGEQVKKVIDNIVSQYLAAQLNLALFGPQANQGQVGGLVGSGLSWLGNLFGMGASAAGSFASFPAPTGNVMGMPLDFGLGFTFPVAHAGGIVGGPMPLRAVSSAAFVGARRYHSGGLAGLSASEVPIIAQKGERILPAGAGNVRQVFNIINPSFTDRRSIQQVQAQLGRTVKQASRNL